VCEPHTKVNNSVRTCWGTDRWPRRARQALARTRSSAVGGREAQGGEAEKSPWDVNKRAKRYTPRCSETACFTAIFKPLISDYGFS